MASPQELEMIDKSIRNAGACMGKLLTLNKTPNLSQDQIKDVINLMGTVIHELVTQCTSFSERLKILEAKSE